VNTALQLTAAEQALGVSLPHRRMEDWRWTDLRRAITKPYAKTEVKAAATDVERLLAASPFAKIAKARVVFVNGALDEAHSKLGGLDISKNVGKIRLADPLVDLNAKLHPQGVSLSFAGQAEQLVESSTSPLMQRRAPLVCTMQLLWQMALRPPSSKLIWARATMC